jgi:hypothetical protein
MGNEFVHDLVCTDACGIIGRNGIVATGPSGVAEDHLVGGYSAGVQVNLSQEAWCKNLDFFLVDSNLPPICLQKRVV